MALWLDVFHQCFFIPKPTLTEKNLPDQSGRVFIITGGYAGLGKELTKILYSRNGTVYIAGRSEDKANQAIHEIQTAHPSSDGRLEFLRLDLSDLKTIKPGVESFLSKEQRLDVLTNNAGVMQPPAKSADAQGFELQMGTNCLGPFLLTELLLPILQRTAASSPAGSVRVTWASSLGSMSAPKNGVAWDAATGNPKWHAHNMLNYMQTKACNVLLAEEFDRRHPGTRVVSNSWNPGNLSTELGRHLRWYEALAIRALLFPTIYGAYTELFAGWGEEAGRQERKGGYVGPWGRFVMVRPDLVDSPEAGKFWDWCEKETKAYL